MYGDRSAHNVLSSKCGPHGFNDFNFSASFAEGGGSAIAGFRP